MRAFMPPRGIPLIARVSPRQSAAVLSGECAVLQRMSVWLRVLRHHRALRPQSAAEDAGAGLSRARRHRRRWVARRGCVVSVIHVGLVERHLIHFARDCRAGAGGYFFYAEGQPPAPRRPRDRPRRARKVTDKARRRRFAQPAGHTATGSASGRSRVAGKQRVSTRVPP